MLPHCISWWCVDHLEYNTIFEHIVDQPTWKPDRREARDEFLLFGPKGESVKANLGSRGEAAALTANFQRCFTLLSYRSKERVTRSAMTRWWQLYKWDKGCSPGNPYISCLIVSLTDGPPIDQKFRGFSSRYKKDKDKKSISMSDDTFRSLSSLNLKNKYFIQ